MYKIEQDMPSREFIGAWNAAGTHIQHQADTGLSWLRTTPVPPLAEHLSFRIGNQIFFLFIEAAEFRYREKSSLFDDVCKEANAVPCLMPMIMRGGAWKPELPGWGLKHAHTQAPLNPLDLVSDALIEMTDWEVHDFGIEIVVRSLEHEGKQVFSRQSDRKIDPSIWFRDDGGPHFVIVRAARYPAPQASLPDHVESIKQNCSGMSRSGFFASVVMASADDPLDPNANENGHVMPLYRGHGLYPEFEGLRPL